MFQLCCPVRNCTSHLEPRKTGLACGFGHHFDRAREGYWSLIQPQDRKSVKAGDSDAAVLARHRWLTSGHANQLMRFLSPLADAAASNRVLSTRGLLTWDVGKALLAPPCSMNLQTVFAGSIYQSVLCVSRHAVGLGRHGSWPTQIAHSPSLTRVSTAWFHCSGAAQQVRSRE